MSARACKKCFVVKPLTEFHRHPGGPEGRHSWCKACACAAKREASKRRKRVRPPELVCWQAMRARCLQPDSTSYRNYGGRGITICGRWAEFANFLADMGPRPPGTSLDRIDNNGHYEPGNCRWATRTQQTRNRSITIYVTFQGKRMPRAEFAESIGLTPDEVARRLAATRGSARAAGWGVVVGMVTLDPPTPPHEQGPAA